MRKKFGDKKILSPRPLFGHALKNFFAQKNHMTYQIGREFKADIECERRIEVSHLNIDQSLNKKCVQF